MPMSPPLGVATGKALAPWCLLSSAMFSPAKTRRCSHRLAIAPRRAGQGVPVRSASDLLVCWRVWQRIGVCSLSARFDRAVQAPGPSGARAPWLAGGTAVVGHLNRARIVDSGRETEAEPGIRAHLGTWGQTAGIGRFH